MNRKEHQAFMHKIRMNQFQRELPQLQKRYSPGTHFEMFPEMGFENILFLRRWDVGRLCARWQCEMEEARHHLETLLNERFEYIYLMRKERCLKGIIESSILNYIKRERNIDLILLYRSPTDRKVTKILVQYFRSIPDDQKAVWVRLKGRYSR